MGSNSYYGSRVLCAENVSAGVEEGRVAQDEDLCSVSERPAKEGAMTLEHCRLLLNDPSIPHWKWKILKDKETELLKRKLEAQFRAASDRSHKFSCYKRLLEMAFKFYPNRGARVETHYFRNGDHYEVH